MVNTVKFSQFATGNYNTQTNMMVGVSAPTGGINIQLPFVTSWMTSTRPSAPYAGLLGYNTSLNDYEFWNGSSWIEIGSGDAGTVTQINTGTGLTGGPITTTGTIAFAAIAAMSLWANTTAGSAVPTVTPLSTFLLSANDLSDVPNKATARINLGLEIGVNVEAWNAQLDEIAAGTWPGANSITTLGTIAFGTWQSTVIGILYGGTGVSSVTTAPTTAAWAGWDANKNLSANNFIPGFTSIVTSGGTTTLTVGSTYQQYFTGSSNQTLQMPVASTLVAGQEWLITNSSTGTITVNSSGGNQIVSMASGTSIIITCILNSGTTAASWNAILIFDNGGEGTVSPGTQNQLAWYAANGSTVSGLTTANNAVLVTNGSGAPSLSTTLPSGLTIPGYANEPTNTNITSMTGLTGVLQAPAAIASSAGINLLSLTYTASAVNYFQMANAATTSTPVFSVTGTDATVGMSIGSKNSAINILDITSTSSGKINFRNAANSHGTTLTVATAQSTDLTLNLPAADGASSGCAMQTNASGVLSFTSNPVITKVAVQTFTGNGTYTPTTGMKYCIIECLGGGGGGGGCANVGNSAGGGGGGGGYIKVLCTAAQIGSSQSITVGAAANGGTAGNNAGTTGNTSSVGSLFSATGGNGGSGNAGVASAGFGVNGGTGGTTSLTTGTLLVSIPGQRGQAGGTGGSTLVPMPPSGGNSYLGFGAVTTNAAASNGASAAANSGAGGSGAFGSASNQSGGNGGSGIVIITEYISN